MCGIRLVTVALTLLHSTCSCCRLVRLQHVRRQLRTVQGCCGVVYPRQPLSPLFACLFPCLLHCPHAHHTHHHHLPPPPPLNYTVALQLQDISHQLALDLNLVIPLVAKHEPLLLQPAHQLPARLSLLSAALQLPPPATIALLSAAAPQLLGTSLGKLQRNVLQLGRVLSSRGLNPAEVLQARPDLLTQNPGSVEAKLEQLPGALGMSRARVRQLVSQCPELLRRSVSTISYRWVMCEGSV